MENNTFVKIEDKKLPTYNLNYHDLDKEKNYSNGYINFVFLLSIFLTSFTWIMLAFTRK